MNFDSNLFRTLCPFIPNITKECSGCDPDRVGWKMRPLTHLLKLSYINKTKISELNGLIFVKYVFDRLNTIEMGFPLEIYTKTSKPKTC